MFYAYLIAAIVGGVLLVTSLVIGGGHGQDAGGGDVDVDVDGGDASGDHAHDAGATGVLLSLRFWTYFLAFGGGVGALLRWFAHTEEPLCGLLAAGVGAVSGAVAHVVMRRLAGSRNTGLHDESQLVGRAGKLLLPVGPGLLGRVRVTVGNSLVDLVARSDEALPARAEVLVVEVQDQTALVTQSPVPELPED